MEKKAVLKFVGEILSKKSEIINISFEDSTQTVPEWDSLATVNIASALESEYNIEIDIDELEIITSVEGIYNLLNSKNIP